MVDGLQNPAALKNDLTMHQQDSKVLKPNDNGQLAGDKAPVTTNASS